MKYLASFNARKHAKHSLYIYFTSINCFFKNFIFSDSIFFQRWVLETTKYFIPELILKIFYRYHIALKKHLTPSSNSKYLNTIWPIQNWFQGSASKSWFFHRRCTKRKKFQRVLRTIYDARTEIASRHSQTIHLIKNQLYNFEDLT